MDTSLLLNNNCYHGDGDDINNNNNNNNIITKYSDSDSDRDIVNGICVGSNIGSGQRL